jgi:pimeloyl-ACP methyl ester carboxylesterase
MESTTSDPEDSLSQAAILWWILGWLGWALLSVLKLILWTFAAAIFGLWWYQGKLLYQASYQDRKEEKRLLKYNREGFHSPAEYHLPFEEHYLRTEDDENIHVWLILQEARASCPTVLFFHGNAGNIGFHLPNMNKLYLTAGCNICMVEYRGYGNSSGSPSEEGLIADAEAALDFLQDRQDIDANKIVVFGWSLGGAVAIALAHARPRKLAGLIVENTFVSIADMVLSLAQRSLAYNLANYPKTIRAIRVILSFYLTNTWASESRLTISEGICTIRAHV